MTFKANNNPTDRQGLVSYQKRQLELARITEDETRLSRIQSNLEKWSLQMPTEYSRAVPANLPKETIDKIKGPAIRPPYDKFIIITGSDVTNATFTAYSIIHALIKQGAVTPSEVKVTSIMDGYNNIHGMFSSKEWKDNFFDKNSQVLLINNTSKILAQLGSKGEEQFWREIIEHARDNNKLFIITYAADDVEQGKDIFIPLLTSNKELNTTIIKKSVFVNLTDREEGEIKNEQKKSY